MKTLAALAATLAITLAMLSGCTEEGSYADEFGNRYQGELRNGKRHGRGVMAWSDGRRYRGEWRDGKLLWYP